MHSPPLQTRALKQQSSWLQQNWSEPQHWPAQQSSGEAQEQQNPATQPLAGGLQGPMMHCVSRSAQMPPKQLSEQHSLSWVHARPFGCKGRQVPFSHTSQRPHAPQLPLQPSGPHVLPVQSGVQHGAMATQTPRARGIRQRSGSVVISPVLRATSENAHVGFSASQSAFEEQGESQSMSTLAPHRVVPSRSCTQLLQLAGQTSSQARHVPSWQLGVAPSGQRPHCSVPPHRFDCAPQAKSNSWHVNVGQPPHWCPRHSVPSPQVWHAAPPWPHAWLADPDWQASLASQQPSGQLCASQTHWPFWQRWPCSHWPQAPPHPSGPQFRPAQAGAQHCPLRQTSCPPQFTHGAPSLPQAWGVVPGSQMVLRSAQQPSQVPGLQMHVPSKQAVPSGQEPHVPPQPSGPQSWPAQFGTQHCPRGLHAAPPAGQQTPAQQWVSHRSFGLGPSATAV
jgi:hypothetical protein